MRGWVSASASGDPAPGFGKRPGQRAWQRSAAREAIAHLDAGDELERLLDDRALPTGYEAWGGGYAREAARAALATNAEVIRVLRLVGAKGDALSTDQIAEVPAPKERGTKPAGILFVGSLSKVHLWKRPPVACCFRLASFSSWFSRGTADTGPTAANTTSATPKPVANIPRIC